MSFFSLKSDLLNGIRILPLPKLNEEVHKQFHYLDFSARLWFHSGPYFDKIGKHIFEVIKIMSRIVKNHWIPIVSMAGSIQTYCNCTILVHYFCFTSFIYGYTYDNKHRMRLLDVVIDAPFPGNKLMNNDCAHNMMAEALNPTWNVINNLLLLLFFYFFFACLYLEIVKLKVLRVVLAYSNTNHTQE